MTRPKCSEPDYEGAHCYHWVHDGMPCCDCGNNQGLTDEPIDYECKWPLAEGQKR